MKYTYLALALSLVLAPVVASAQPGPGPGGPSPELRAKFEQVRADAKTNSLKALSADHQSKIQAIVDGFNAGTIAAPDAIAQIDAVLSPDESKTVLDQEQKMRDSLRALRPAESVTAGAERPKTEGAGRKPDAGRFVLSLLATPGKMREAIKAMRDHNKPQ
jgi:hypothetical protein